MLGQLGRIKVTAFLEESSQKEIVLERVHVLFERKRSALRLSESRVQVLIGGSIVKERAYGALPAVNFCCNRLQIAAYSVYVRYGNLGGFDRFSRAFEHFGSFLCNVRVIERRTALYQVAIVYGSACFRAKGN